MSAALNRRESEVTALQQSEEVKLIEKAVASLGISKAAVKANAGTKTAVVTHLSKVKPHRSSAALGVF